MIHQNFEWQDILCREQRPDACRIVIFGASGDLAKRKLFPSLAALDAAGLLAEETQITGCARHWFEEEAFHLHLMPFLPPGIASSFCRRLRYQRLEYDSPGDFLHLRQHLETLKNGTPVIFYLALPASVYPEVLRQLDRAGLLRETPSGGARRVVFEKPFGYDLASSAALDVELHRHLQEHQIYRIDHYLGKETVQNIFLLRFANRIWEPVWNGTHIDSIQITAAEMLGVEERAGYFEQAGLVRDMFQNHLLEMLSLVTMECPSSFAADAIRDEKVKLIRSILPIDFTRAVRAQYEGYLQEPGVAPDSRTETYAALRLQIGNPRWAGVPVYLRAGKRLGVRRTEIDILFRPVAHSIFPGISPEDLQQNILHLRVQPGEGIGLTLQAKKAGPKLCMGSLTLNYDYQQSGGEVLDAYARLLLDCQLGDPTLFLRSDAITAAWQLYQPLLEHWSSAQEPPPFYRCGSSGPDAGNALPRMDGRYWIDSLQSGAHEN